MYKKGKVVEVDYEKGYARVEFPDDDGLRSDWLQVVQKKTKTDKYYSMPDVGEYVACVMDDGCEEGVVIGAMYADDNKPISDLSGGDLTSAKLGEKLYLRIERSNGIIELNITDGYFEFVNGDTRVQINPASVNVISETINITGDVSIDGNLTVQGNITAEGISASGDITTDGSITAEGNIRGKGEIEAGPIGASVKLTTHMHPTAPVGPPSPPTPNT